MPPVTKAPKVPDAPTQPGPAVVAPQPVETEPGNKQAPAPVASANPAKPADKPVMIEPFMTRIRELEHALRPFARMPVDENESPDQPAYILAKRGAPVPILNKEILQARAVLDRA